MVVRQVDDLSGSRLDANTLIQGTDFNRGGTSESQVEQA